MGRLRVWRAVDAEGEDLDVLVQSKRKKPRHCEIDAQASEEIRLRSGTVGHDDLRFCGAAARDLDTSACMNAPDGRTIGRRIRIGQLDGGSARCNVSRAPALLRDSSQRMPRSTALSMSNAWREVVDAA